MSITIVETLYDNPLSGCWFVHDLLKPVFLLDPDIPVNGSCPGTGVILYCSISILGSAKQIFTKPTRLVLVPARDILLQYSLKC